MTPYKKTILGNGVRVLTIPMPGNPTVTVMVHVATGSFYETPEQSGLSHFLEHMCFKGTVKRPTARDISTELDSIGAIYNAFTGREVTGYWAKADSRHFSKIADVCADIFKNSVFPEGEIEKEKGVVIGEIDMYADDPQEKIFDALRIHMYKGEPAERDVLGSKETVSSFIKKDLISYRQSHYTSANTLVTVAGGISEDEAVAWAKTHFSDLSDVVSLPELSTRDREQTSPEAVFIDKDTDQAHIVMAWRTFPREHEDRYVVSIIRSLLRDGMSSRLFTKLRDEMGSGYYVSANHSAAKTFGMFSISTGTKHERVAEIIGAILSETEKLKTEPVTETELEKVREYKRAHRLMSLETSDEVADFHADQEIIEKKILSPEDFEEIFKKITPQDVMRVARVIFDTNKLTAAVIGKDVDKTSVEKTIGKK